MVVLRCVCAALLAACCLLLAAVWQCCWCVALVCVPVCRCMCALLVCCCICAWHGVRRVGCGHGPGVCGVRAMRRSVWGGGQCALTPGCAACPCPCVCEGVGYVSRVSSVSRCPLGIADVPMYRPHYIGTTKAW